MALAVKNPLANAGDIRDTGSMPGSGRSPGGGHGNPLQYSCLENPMDRGARQATVHRVAKSRTRLKRQHARTPLADARQPILLFFFLIFFYLVATDLSCSMKDLSLRCSDSLAVASSAACRILAP